MMTMDHMLETREKGRKAAENDKVAPTWKRLKVFREEERKQHRAANWSLGAAPAPTSARMAVRGKG